MCRLLILLTHVVAWVPQNDVSKDHEDARREDHTGHCAHADSRVSYGLSQEDKGALTLQVGCYRTPTYLPCALRTKTFPSREDMKTGSSPMVVLTMACWAPNCTSLGCFIAGGLIGNLSFGLPVVTEHHYTQIGYRSGQCSPVTFQRSTYSTVHIIQGACQ